MEMGRVDAAETLYRQVAGADPRNAMAVVGLARVALEHGDEPEAYRIAQRALAIDPENSAAQRMVTRLAEVLRYRGEPVPDDEPTPDARPVPGHEPAPRLTRRRRRRHRHPRPSARCSTAPSAAESRPFALLRPVARPDYDPIGRGHLCGGRTRSRSRAPSAVRLRRRAGRRGRDLHRRCAGGRAGPAARRARRLPGLARRADARPGRAGGARRPASDRRMYGRARLALSRIRRAAARDPRRGPRPPRAWAAKWGFGVSTSVGVVSATPPAADPNLAYVDSLTPAQGEAYRAALFGSSTEPGCNRQANELIYGRHDRLLAGLAPDLARLEDQIAHDARIVDADARWMACIATASFRPSSRQHFGQEAIDLLTRRLEDIMGPPPGDPDVDVSALARLQAFEIDLALRGFDCDEGVRAVSEAVRLEHESQFVDDHRAALDDVKAQAVRLDAELGLAPGEAADPVSFEP